VRCLSAIPQRPKALTTPLPAYQRSTKLNRPSIISKNRRPNSEIVSTLAQSRRLAASGISISVSLIWAGGLLGHNSRVGSPSLGSVPPCRRPRLRPKFSPNRRIADTHTPRLRRVQGFPCSCAISHSFSPQANSRLKLKRSHTVGLFHQHGGQSDRLTHTDVPANGHWPRGAGHRRSR
jgi:hypothetical protein